MVIKVKLVKESLVRIVVLSTYKTPLQFKAGSTPQDVFDVKNYFCSFSLDGTLPSILIYQFKALTIEQDFYATLLRPGASADSVTWFFTLGFFSNCFFLLTQHP
jgi:hypothetical protein